MIYNNAWSSHRPPWRMKISVNYPRMSRPVDVLAFRKDQDTAVIVTYGRQTRVYERTANTAVASLKRGIAMLESKGYAIDTEAWL